MNKFFLPDSVLKAGGRISKWGDLTPYFVVQESVCTETTYNLHPRDWVGVIKNSHGVVGGYTNFTLPWWSDQDTLSCAHFDSCYDDSLSTYHNTIIYNINGVALDHHSEGTCRLFLCNADTLLWQKKYIAGIDSTLGDSLLANAVYTDRGGFEILCYRGNNHSGHPNGGGSYYIQGRKKLMETIDEHIADLDTVIITMNEAAYDVKMGWYDYYANWGGFMGGITAKEFPRLIQDEWKTIEEVPMMPAVWHENQATMMGLIRRSYSHPDSTKAYGVNHWAFGLAYVLMNGSMPAFRQDLDPLPWDARQQDDYSYIKSLINMRNDIRDYLIYGEWMRPPTLYDLDSTEVRFWNFPALELPAILSAAYLKVDSLGAEEDSLALFFTNFSDTTIDDEITASCSVAVDLSSYFGFQPATFQLCELVHDTIPVNCDTVANDSLILGLTLASDSTAVLQIVPLTRSARGFPERQRTYIIED